MGIGVLLAACGATGASTSPSSAPATATADAPTATADAPTATCMGVDAPDLSVAEPARTYRRAWNETDADARLTLLEEIWANDGTYVVGEMAEPIVGREALSDNIASFGYGGTGDYAEWRGWRPDNMHHDRVMMPWRVCSADGETLLEGTDFGVIDADGRLVEVVGFPSE
jgi:hypothetical protein